MGHYPPVMEVWLTIAYNLVALCALYGTTNVMQHKDVRKMQVMFLC